jgi:spoIIIJ-associated protein
VSLKPKGGRGSSKPAPSRPRTPRKPRASKPANTPKAVTSEQTAEIVNSEEITALAITTVNDILATTNVDVVCNISSHHSLAEGTVALELSGSDTGLLIGRRGQTLMSLQFLVNSIVRSKTGENIRIAIDAEGYRDRRENTLKEMAMRVAERVKETGRSITLEPMNAADRRIIHVSLTEYEGVRTESIGEAENRKVEIYPED